MISTETREKLRQQVKDILVIPINMVALNTDIDANLKKQAELAKGSDFAPKIEPNEFFKIRGAIAVIKGTNILIDTECIGSVADEIVLDVYSEKRNEDGATKSFGMFPSIRSRMKLADLVAAHGQTEIPLDVFMDDRFAYNERVASNMVGMLKKVKEQKKNAKNLVL